MNTVRVRAKELAFHQGTRRRPGEVFMVREDSVLAPWMELVPDDTPVGKAPPLKIDESGISRTLSAITRKASKDAPKGIAKGDLGKV